MWIQNFCLTPAPAAASDDGGDAAIGDDVVVRWRTTTESFPPSLLRVASPYDLDVRYAKKRSTRWLHRSAC